MSTLYMSVVDPNPSNSLVEIICRKILALDSICENIQPWPIPQYTHLPCTVFPYMVGKLVLSEH